MAGIERKGERVIRGEVREVRAVIGRTDYK